MCRFVLAGQHHGFSDAGALDQTRFDFTQFDTETTDFHLVVVTAQILDNPVCVPATKVASAVQQGSSVVAERVGDKLGGVQLRAVQVTLGHALSADIQLPRYSDRYRLAQGIEHIDLTVANRPADGYTAAADRGDLMGRGKGRRFGRAVAVEQVLRCAFCQYPGDYCRVQHVPPDDQVAQPGEGLHQAAGILMKQARGHPQHADRLRQQQRAELVK